MASVYKRKKKDGKGFTSYRAVVRITGHPTVCEHFSRKEEAVDWAVTTEAQIKEGRFDFSRHKNKSTFNDLVESYFISGRLEHHRSAKDTVRHLKWWQERLGAYDLKYLTNTLILQERQALLNTPTEKGKRRENATVNRYMSSLSSMLTYAWQELGWISENPYLKITKLKESGGRDRPLSEEEAFRLLNVCRESPHPYLYCIFLLAITTGARQGEILSLEWRDVNFENRCAFFRVTKNSHARSTFLPDEVLAELKRLYDSRKERQIKVFPSLTLFGKGVCMKKPWKAAFEKAKIQNFRPHDLRHTFATLASNAGASNIELSTCTGHKTLAMLKRYCHQDAHITKKYNEAVSHRIHGWNVHMM